MTTVFEFAAMLNGRQYREEITRYECSIAKDSGFVVVFGASDDLMEFRGAIDDEIGAYGGNTAYLTINGLLQNKCEDDDCPYFSKEKQSAATIEAVFDKDGFSWVYETKIPHTTFVIMEDDETYCRGIVFRLEDVK